MRRTINVGDRVRVHIPATDADGSITKKLARQYNGKVMTVTKKMTWIRSWQAGFELAGAESPAGIPYTFAAEWLEVV